MQGLVTVFGGSGFLGRYAVRALARDDWRIRVAMRRPPLAPELRVMGDVGQIELMQANVRVPASVEAALEGADAAVNLVGALYERGRQKFQALHVEAPRAIAKTAARMGVRKMVQVSAIGADPASPSSYARTKGQGEAAVRAAFPDAVVIRPSVVFGEEDDFFNRFAAMATMSPALPLIGGGKTLFQPVYAGDVGAAIARVLASPAPTPLYEVGGPAVLSFRDLMQIVLSETSHRRLLAPVPWGIAALIGAVGDLVAFTPFPPPLTSDQVKLLRTDNVASPTAPGLADLGITATSIEAVLPTFLWKYRRGGQFATPTQGRPAENPL